ncbi:MAG TPA: sugar phosphate isomerase/epimerase [Candidatus Eisenbacteria bacterium]|nr:sugar phosphate isomerase/epimerase [Candidatus Eisenbacteria bacterium]
MSPTSRRDFLKLASAASVAAIAFRDAFPLDAYPLGLPLGLQLYSLRELLPKDFDGTLKAIAAGGYTEVEAAGFYAMSAQDFKQSMDAAGLRCVSAHYPLSMLQPQLESILDYAKQLGLQYVVCSSPSLKDPSRVRLSPKDPGYHEAWVQAFTLDDWKWNAEQFNEIAGRVKGYRMKFGYHNHTTAFHKLGKVVPYDELMKLTDPELVTFEMDCGWVAVAGYSPAEYLTKYPTRISMLHVKDFDLKKGTEHPQSTELGHGTIDYRPIFEAAKKGGHITHYFVEQEEFDMPPLEAIKLDAEYMRNLKV